MGFALCIMFIYYRPSVFLCSLMYNQVMHSPALFLSRREAPFRALTWPPPLGALDSCSNTHSAYFLSHCLALPLPSTGANLSPLELWVLLESCNILFSAMSLLSFKSPVCCLQDWRFLWLLWVLLILFLALLPFNLNISVLWAMLIYKRQYYTA